MKVSCKYNGENAHFEYTSAFHTSVARFEAIATYNLSSSLFRLKMSSGSSKNLLSLSHLKKDVSLSQFRPKS